MARTKRGTPPSYRRHSSGQACVTVRDLAGRRREILLGPWNSPESKAEYARVLAELAAHQGPFALHQHTVSAFSDLTVNELILAFWQHAQQHYRHPDGRPTGELSNLQDALRPLRRLYGLTPAREFDSLALESIQQELVREGALARTTINARINRIRRVFRWAVRKKLVPGAIMICLEAVPGLQRGRTEAREPEGIAPVAWEHVEAALPFMPRPVAALVQVQWLCGCRAGEVLIMRGCDLTPGEPNWIFQPNLHKNAWRGRPRIIILGPKAQEIIKQFLRPNMEEFLFRPGDATVEHHARRAAQRRSKRSPSERKRQRRPQPRRKPGPRYDRRSYRQAVVRACQKAGVPVWSPLQLRHARASEIRRGYGLEASQCVLGHARADVTQIYAQRNEALAARVMAEIG
jgi:integrase